MSQISMELVVIMEDQGDPRYDHGWGHGLKPKDHLKSECIVMLMDDDPQEQL